MLVKSAKSGKNARSHTLVIPSALAANLPAHVEWEIDVTDEGFTLVYRGEYTPGTGRSSAPALTLPFVQR